MPKQTKYQLGDSVLHPDGDVGVIINIYPDGRIGVRWQHGQHLNYSVDDATFLVRGMAKDVMDDTRDYLQSLTDLNDKK